MRFDYEKDPKHDMLHDWRRNIAYFEIVQTKKLRTLHVSMYRHASRMNAPIVEHFGNTYVFTEEEMLDTKPLSLPQTPIVPFHGCDNIKSLQNDKMIQVLEIARTMWQKHLSTENEKWKTV